MPGVKLYGYVEDPPSGEIARRIVSHVNQKSVTSIQFVDGFPKIENGYGNIKKKVPALVQMAQNGVFAFVIVDLDLKECAPALLQEWIGRTDWQMGDLPKPFLFRVAIREIESWIIADRVSLSKFLGISEKNFSSDPDLEKDPKQHLLNVIDKKGRKKWHREMLPQGNMSIGPRYNEKLCEFVRTLWNPDVARQYSPSLSRAILALEKAGSVLTI